MSTEVHKTRSVTTKETTNKTKKWSEATQTLCAALVVCWPTNKHTHTEREREREREREAITIHCAAASLAHSVNRFVWPVWIKPSLDRPHSKFTRLWLWRHCSEVQRIS